MKLVAWEALPESRRASYEALVNDAVRDGIGIDRAPGMAERTYEGAVALFAANFEYQRWPSGRAPPLFAETYVDGLFDAMVNMAVSNFVLEAD